ncbi:MAG: hypothetical protein ACODAU_11375 [Myxococcota bacterium]
MRTSDSLPFVVMALAGTAGVLGCGGSDPQLEPRFVAVHNALVASGMSQSGALHRGVLDQGEEQRIVLELSADRCHTIVALGARRVRDLDLRVRDEGGEEVGEDTTGDRQAAVRVCPDRSGAHQVIVRMARGAGEFVLGSWSGGSSVGGSGAAVAASATRRAAGTCAEPLSLELGRPLQGDTRLGNARLGGSCGRGNAPEQVYQLELDERSQLSVRVQSEFDSVIYLRESCSDSDSEMACNDDAERGQTGRSEIDVTVDAGTWFLVVDGYREEAGDYELIASASPLRPVAEVCRDASELRPGQSTSGSTAGSSDQFQASCAGGASSPDRVYRLDVGQRSRLRVRQQSDHDGALHLRTDCTEARSEIACNDDFADPHHSAIHRVVQAGTVYVITDGFSGRGRTSAGNYSVTADLEPADGSGVPGDECADPLVVGPGQQVDLDTFPARDDLTGSCGGGGAPDVVYAIEVRRRSRLRARVHGAEFTGAMYLRRRCDDERSEQACVEVPSASPRDRMASLDAVVSRGTHYLVIDGEDEHAFGAAKLEVQLVDLARVERTCRTAPLLTPGRAESGSTAGREDDLQGGCMQVGGGPDTIYRLDVRRRSRVTLNLTSEFDAVLHVRRDCVDRETEIGCNDDHGDNRHSRVEATLDRGRYYVIVDGFRGDQAGDFTLEASVDPL